MTEKKKKKSVNVYLDEETVKRIEKFYSTSKHGYKVKVKYSSAALELILIGLDTLERKEEEKK